MSYTGEEVIVGPFFYGIGGHFVERVGEDEDEGVLDAFDLDDDGGVGRVVGSEEHRHPDLGRDDAEVAVGAIGEADGADETAGEVEGEGGEVGGWLPGAGGEGLDDEPALGLGAIRDRGGHGGAVLGEDGAHAEGRGGEGHGPGAGEDAASAGIDGEGVGRDRCVYVQNMNPLDRVPAESEFDRPGFRVLRG